VNGFLQAVHDEIETLWTGYQSNVGNRLEALVDGQPFLYYYPVTQDPFTVYNTNAFLIGRVSDPDLRRLIVMTYARGRGLLESFRLNNDYVGKFDHWHLMSGQPGINGEFCKNNAQTYWNSAQQYAKSLKIAHSEVKSLQEQLLRTLRQMGVTTKAKQN
jgi:hypothetical protein